MTGDDPFAGTAAHYARSRPDFGGAPIAYLRDRFALDGARVLDLGCGTGQLAVPIAAFAGTVVAMDPNESMLRATEERAAEAGRENLETVVGSDADLREQLIGGSGSGDKIAPFDCGAPSGGGTPLGDVIPLNLTTMGRSFHWMDARPTLDCLREHTTPGGGVAIVDDVEWLTAGDEPWTGTVYEVASRFLADLPERYDPETVEYEDPWDELLAERGFADVETATFAVEREWSVDRIVDYVFSLSFASPGHFGDERAAFERALRDELSGAGGGPFEQTARVEVCSGRRA